jgi:hypothetical protein
MLRCLFAKRNNNIFNRILPICTNPYYTDNVVVVKRNTNNTLIFSNNITYFGKNNTHSNFKSFSPSKLNITSKVNNG